MGLFNVLTDSFPSSLHPTTRRNLVMTRSSHSLISAALTGFIQFQAKEEEELDREMGETGDTSQVVDEKVSSSKTSLKCSSSKSQNPV